jgi:hypothetical protein
MLPYPHPTAPSKSFGRSTMPKTAGESETKTVETQPLQQGTDTPGTVKAGCMQPAVSQSALVTISSHGCIVDALLVPQECFALETEVSTLHSGTGVLQQGQAWTCRTPDDSEMIDRLLSRGGTSTRGNNEHTEGAHPWMETHRTSYRPPLSQALGGRATVLACPHGGRGRGLALDSSQLPLAGHVPQIMVDSTQSNDTAPGMSPTRKPSHAESRLVGCVPRSALKEPRRWDGRWVVVRGQPSADGRPPVYYSSDGKDRVVCGNQSQARDMWQRGLAWDADLYCRQTTSAWSDGLWVRPAVKHRNVKGRGQAAAYLHLVWLVSETSEYPPGGRKRSTL